MRCDICKKDKKICYCGLLEEWHKCEEKYILGKNILLLTICRDCAKKIKKEE